MPTMHDELTDATLLLGATASERLHQLLHLIEGGRRIRETGTAIEGMIVIETESASVQENESENATAGQINDKNLVRMTSPRQATERAKELSQAIRETAEGPAAGTIGMRGMEKDSSKDSPMSRDSRAISARSTRPIRRTSVSGEGPLPAERHVSKICSHLSMTMPARDMLVWND